MSCFKDGEFDRVRAVGTIHHMPEYPKVLREIGRVLKPCGSFVFMFYNDNAFKVKYIYPHRAKKLKTTVEKLVLLYDGPSNPFTKLLSKNEITKLCSDANLTCDKFQIRELPYSDRCVPIGGKRIPVLPKFFERFWGFSRFVYGHRM